MNEQIPDHTILGLVFTMVLATVRILYDNEEVRPVRVALEATLCGCLSVAASFAIAALGLDMYWAVFAGGVIGFLGADFIRFIAKRYVSNNYKKF